jgi:hypothetical protein
MDTNEQADIMPTVTITTLGPHTLLLLFTLVAAYRFILFFFSLNPATGYWPLEFPVL